MVAPGVFLFRTKAAGEWKSVRGSLENKGNVLELRCEIDGVKTRARIVLGEEGEVHIFREVRP